jgi:hypothetical protein
MNDDEDTVAAAGAGAEVLVLAVGSVEGAG